MLNERECKEGQTLFSNRIGLLQSGLAFNWSRIKLLVQEYSAVSKKHPEVCQGNYREILYRFRWYTHHIVTAVVTMDTYILKLERSYSPNLFPVIAFFIQIKSFSIGIQFMNTF